MPVPRTEQDRRKAESDYRRESCLNQPNRFPLPRGELSPAPPVALPWHILVVILGLGVLGAVVWIVVLEVM